MEQSKWSRSIAVSWR